MPPGSTASRPPRQGPPDDDDLGTLLSVRVERGAITVLHLDGELCPFTAPWLDDHLAEAIDEADPQVALDADRLRLLTAAGIGVIVAADQRAAARGGGVWITRPSDTVRRVLRACDLEQLTLEPARRAELPAVS